MTTILSERDSLLGGVQHLPQVQVAIDAAVAAAESKIRENAFDFATGALGTQIALEPNMFGGVGIYTLKDGDHMAGKQLSVEQARGLRDYLTGLNLG